jgi:ParB/RepB/Spo0J family partition protein
MNTKIERLLNGTHHNPPPGARASRHATADVQKLPVGSILPDPDNARKTFDADELAALAEDIKRHGQLQNAVAFETDTPGVFQLVAGERRWRACQLAGIPTLVCMVLPRDMAREVREEIAFAENMARSDLKPVEVARHWQALLERWKCSTRELAARVGVAQSTVSKRLALLKLNPETQNAIDAGQVHRTAAVESTRTRRRTTGGRRHSRGVHVFNAGTVKLKRGAKLAELVAELNAAIAAGDQPQAAAA